jgi:YHS domain-containing protein
MKTKTIWGMGITLVILSVFLIGCGGAEQTQSETPATQKQAAPQTAETAKAYPLDYCLVSGEKLGSMGKPAVENYMGREIRFCCAGCISAFRKNPDMYIAKLDSAAAGLLKHPEGEKPMEGHEGHSHGG